MSFALSKQSTYARIPFVRYSARTKRENRIQVQLLKDFPQYGQRGEIISILPGLMRNKLYHHNGACYVNPKLGLHPRIPVVERQKRPIIEQEAQKVETVQTTITEKVKRVKKETEPVEIKGLLFDLPQGTADSKVTIKGADSSYSLFQLEVNLDQILIGSTAKDGEPSIPISKSQIVQHIKQSAGISVPESDITIFEGKEKIPEVTKFGEYELVISQESTLVEVRKPLFVESA